jgi:hypothetical protein
MPGSPQWSLSLRFSHQNPIHASLLPIPLHALSIWFFSILSLAQYWVRSTDYVAPHCVILSTLLLHVPPSALTQCNICIVYYLSPTCFGSHCAIFTENVITSQNHLLIVTLLKRLSYGACNIPCGGFTKLLNSLIQYFLVVMT